MTPPSVDASPLAPAPQRILVRGVNWLGDAVMTTPALARLRERFPRAHLTLLTQEKLADLWRHHPAIDQVLPFPGDAHFWQVASLISAAARSSPFDLALILPNSPRSALEPWLARIPQRLGSGRRWRNWLLTHRVPAYPAHCPMQKRSLAEIRRLLATPGRPFAPPPAAHQMHEYLHLVAALGAQRQPLAPQLVVTASELQRAEEELLSGRWARVKEPAAAQPSLFLGLNPGAEYGPAKRWPAAHFAAVAREISRRKQRCRWLLFGAPRDAALAAEIAASGGPQILNLAGKTSLRELMALLKLCRVIVTNDTGPMHLAAALGTPVVVPFGSTSPELTGPGLPGDPRHRLLKGAAACAPCFQRTCPIDLRCLTSIAPDRVVSAVLGILDASRAG